MPRIPDSEWVDIRDAMSDEEIVEALLAGISRRRTRYTTVSCRHARVRLTAPERLESRVVREFVEKKLGWLKKTLRKQRLALEDKPQTGGGNFCTDSDLRAGGTVCFFGRKLELRQGKTERYRIDLQTMTLEIPVLTGAGGLSAGEEFASRVAVWLMDALQGVLARLADHYRNRLESTSQRHRPLGKVRLSQALSRWGSCTIHGNIRINWRLAALPIRFVNYVFAHEAAHLTHFNHAPQFWACVEQYFPECHAARSALKNIPISRLFAAPIAPGAVLRRLGLGKGLYERKTEFIDSDGMPCGVRTPEDLVKSWSMNREN